MVRHKIKKAVAIAMSAVIALTAVPNKNIVQTVKADEKSKFGENTSDIVDIDTGFTNKSGDEYLSGNFDVRYTFTNKTKDSSANWFNFAVEIWDTNNGENSGYTARADNYGWFYGGDKYNHNNDGSKATWDNINFVWDDFAKSMEDASVTVDIHRAERSVVLKYNIVDNKDNSKVYSLRNTIEFGKFEDTVGMHLTGEKCTLSNIKAVDMTDNTTESSEPTEISASEVQSKYNTYFNSSNQKNHVTVHDPSVVIGYTDTKYTGNKNVKIYGVQNTAKTRKKVYFIFGSHRAFAWSTDMQNWNYFQNNINNDTTCQALFKDAFNWAKQGDASYQWDGNLWAPDVIWNPDYVNSDGSKGAWCMYMSINGNSWNSSIVLLTSDDLDGDWTNRGTVVYSGFTESGVHDYKDTDFANIVGSDENAKKFISEHYKRGSYTPSYNDGKNVCSKTNWNNYYGAHAIDPCVTYDSEGRLWMSYGSWSGGIWMFELSTSTGLRDASIEHTYKDNESDPYMGYKLAGGNQKSGEASYIEKIGSKYYLFVSYGGFAAKGGYNMRVFASDKINGPYKDVAGNDARYGSSQSDTTSTDAGNTNGVVGEHLMSYYKWSYLDKGRVAEGHNSAVADDDGKAYVVYHTRFNDGTEGHQVRVHQLFKAKNGGLVATPFEYSGETLSKSAYSNDEVEGEYKVILHKQKVDNNNLECCNEETIKLNKNGTVTGDYSGSWVQSEDGPYVTIVAGGVVYQGVFIKQKIEGTAYETMCFTTVGNNNVTFWGTKGYTDEAIVIKDAGMMKVTVPEKTYVDLSLPTNGDNGSRISWSSSDTSVMSDNGEVIDAPKDVKVTLTATITYNNYSTKKTYETIVTTDKMADKDSGLEANYTFENGLRNEADTTQTGTAKKRGSGTTPTIEYNKDRSGNVLKQGFGANGNESYTEFSNPLKGKTLSGVTVSQWVNCPSEDLWDALWSFYDTDSSDSKDGRVFFTPNAYLGYNGTVNGINKWFDLNRADKTTGNIWTNQWHYVTVSLGKSDFGIYVDGKLVCDKSKYTLYAGSSYAAAAEDMLNVISSSDRFYLGYGSFWGSAPAYMDNVRIYSRALNIGDVAVLYNSEKEELVNSKNAEQIQEKVMQIQEKAMQQQSIFYKNYNADTDAKTAGWTSTSAQGSLTLAGESDDAYRGYVQFAPGNVTGGRSAYTSFGNVTLPDKYVVEFDAKLTAGNTSSSQLALSTAAYSRTNCESSNINYSLLNTSYLWSLDTTNSTSWNISSGSTASTAKTDTVTIAKNTWTHFKTTVDKTNKKVTLEITDASGKTLKKIDIAMSSISDVKGLWYLSGRANGVAGFDNVRIYEESASQKYSVCYSPNHVAAGTTIETQEFTVNESQKLKKNEFTRDGYEFIGWSKTPDGAVDYADEQSVKNLAGATEAVVLYAVWKEDSYTVKYNANGAAGEEILQYGKPGCGIRLIENAYVRNGYKFSGWATTKDGIVLYKNAQEILADLAEKNQTVTLYAVWEDTHQFTIKFNSNGGSGSMSNQSALNNAEFKLSKCRFSRTGYTFAGWAETANGTVVYNDEQSIDKKLAETGGTISLYAVWNKNAVVSTPTPTPTVTPTVTPSQKPASSQTPAPGSSATTKPTDMPSKTPTVKPTEVPTQKPTTNPSAEPTVSPSNEPAVTPSVSPSTEPEQTPTAAPTKKPATKKLKSAAITVKKGKKKVSSVTVKRKKTVKLSVSVNSKAKLSMAKLSKKYAKIVKVKFKKNKLTIKALKKKGKVSIKITSKKTSKYKAASKTIKVTVK